MNINYKHYNLRFQSISISCKMMNMYNSSNNNSLETKIYYGVLWSSVVEGHATIMKRDLASKFYLLVFFFANTTFPIFEFEFFWKEFNEFLLKQVCSLWTWSCQWEEIYCFRFLCRLAIEFSVDTIELRRTMRQRKELFFYARMKRRLLWHSQEKTQKYSLLWKVNVQRFQSIDIQNLICSFWV